MRVLVQKALDASVSCDGELLGTIGRGFVLLIGFTGTDREPDLDHLAKKVALLRIFPDEDGKLNKNISEAGGDILSIPQFTLYGDCTEGNRPSFTSAAPGETAFPLYEKFNAILSGKYGLKVVPGRFGAHMAVRFTNDGPVTILLESKKNDTGGKIV